MIDTVTFDLWNTLMVNSPPDMEKYRLQRVRNLERILQAQGHSVTSGQLLDAYTKGFDKCREVWDKNLDLSTEEQLGNLFGFLADSRLKEAVGSLMPELMEAYVSPILDDPPGLVEGAGEILAELKQGGHKIGLICNTGTTPGETIRALLERFGMIGSFDATTFSNELGIRKPDPRIFLQTLARLRATPQTSLHVGDLMDVDVLGARNVGMIAVHLNSGWMSCQEVLPPCSQELLPDFSIGRLADLKRVLDELK